MCLSQSAVRRRVMLMLMLACLALRLSSRCSHHGTWPREHIPHTTHANAMPNARSCVFQPTNQPTATATVTVSIYLCAMAMSRYSSRSCTHRTHTGRNPVQWRERSGVLLAAGIVELRHTSRSIEQRQQQTTLQSAARSPRPAACHAQSTTRASCRVGRATRGPR